MELELSPEIMAFKELKFLSMRNSCAISIQREMFKARSCRLEKRLARDSRQLEDSHSPVASADR